MEQLNIEIINPKARRLLRDLERLNLISIKKMPEMLSTLFARFKKDSEVEITDEEIIAEVEAVRKELYEKKG